MIEQSITKSASAQKSNLMMADASAMAISAVAAAQAVANNNGVYTYSGVEPIEQFDRPKSCLVSSVGFASNGTTPAIVNVYAFNTSTFNTTKTSAGAASVLESYNDGFLGKNIDKYLLTGNGGRGLRVKQITFTAKDADGNQDLSILENLQFAIVSYTTNGGRQIPEVIDLSEAIRNTAFQSGVLTINREIWLNTVSQASWVTPAGCSVTANFIF